MGMDFLKAAQMIKAQPSKYAAREIDRANRISTPGRKRQAIIGAGRAALANALFEMNQELNGDFSKLTRAVRKELGDNFNFEELNKTGARAIGFEI